MHRVHARRDLANSLKPPVVDPVHQRVADHSRYRTRNRVRERVKGRSVTESLRSLELSRSRRRLPRRAIGGRVNPPRMGYAPKQPEAVSDDALVPGAPPGRVNRRSVAPPAGGRAPDQGVPGERSACGRVLESPAASIRPGWGTVPSPPTRALSQYVRRAHPQVGASWRAGYGSPSG